MPTAFKINGKPVQAFEGETILEVTELVTNLGRTLARLSAEAKRDEKVRYGSDAGWNHIWKSISVKNVLW